MKEIQSYSYEDAGFNAFFSRALGSSTGVARLKDIAPARRSRDINFDDQQVSGRLGDSLQAGTIEVDGKNGRINIRDEQGNIVTRLGNIRAQ